MKAAAYIFSILTLFFTAQPFLVRCQQAQAATAETPVCSSSTCSSKKTEDKTETKDCDKTTSCNPFASCSGCHYLPNARMHYKSMTVFAETIKKYSFAENPVSGFIADCWNPPEPGFIYTGTSIL